jgi:hypothetical protein
MKNWIRFSIPTSIVLMAALASAPAAAITAAVCVKATLKGPIKLRADTPCKASEIQIGSFDGTTLQFSGINLQVVSGSGATDGPINGTGNLIVGYNEGRCPGFISAFCNTDADCPADTCLSGLCQVSLASCSTDADCSVCTHDDQDGSHNLVVGPGHQYPSVGGFVAGSTNRVGPYSSVTGGAFNSATGTYAAIGGGTLNQASGDSASVSGGRFNWATGDRSSVSGGLGVTESNVGGWAAGSSGPDTGPGKFFSH